MKVHEIIENVDPDHFAITDSIGRLSYGDITKNYHLYPDYSGRRVIIMMDNSYKGIVDLFSVMHNGGIPAIVGMNTPDDKLDMIVDEFKPHHILANDVWGNYTPDEPAEPIDEDVAFLLYTSGSTGKPKGVLCTHDAVFAAINSINEYLGMMELDRTAIALPLSHGYGLYQVLCAFSVGAQVCLLPNIALLGDFYEAIDKFDPTGLAVVPTMLSHMFRSDGWKEHLKGLEYITIAGDAMPPTYYWKLAEELKDTSIIPMHGLTECVRTMYLPGNWTRYHDPHHTLPTGVPIPGVALTLRDDDGRPVAGDEIIGELHIAGRNVMKGYFNRPEQTAETFKKADDDTIWLASGDLFYRKGKYFYYVSRKDDMVKIRGEKVYPKEVEKIIYEMENVVQVAVVAKEDEKQGHKLVAHIVGEDVTPASVKRLVVGALGRLYVPDVVLHNELPKNANGKLDRKALARL